MWTHRLSGQNHARGDSDHRSPYERDRTRVIHCPAFRRLQRKTQILGTDEGDFHRTRLTHSLEVASIASSIVRQLSQDSSDSGLVGLLPCNDLTQVVCLLHDIGHPPFGHGGETALNFKMRAYGGFEGNAQTLRLLTKTEESYGTHGLDLTRRSILGILKYPVPWSRVVAPVTPIAAETHPMRMNDWIPPKAYFDQEQAIVDWLLEPLAQDDLVLFQTLKFAPQESQHGRALYKSLDCSIMDIADDIAYGVHDLEDAIHLRLIHRYQLETEKFHQLVLAAGLNWSAEQLLDALFDPFLHTRKQAIGEMVNYFITSVRLGVTHEAFDNQILKHNAVLPPDAAELLDYLVQSIYCFVIDSQESRTFEHGGQIVISRLFDALSSNPHSLLDIKNREKFRQWEDKDEALAYRVICDYIANMTDEYAYRMHERLFGFNTRTIFERL